MCEVYLKCNLANERKENKFVNFVIVDNFV